MIFQLFKSEKAGNRRRTKNGDETIKGTIQWIQGSQGDSYLWHKDQLQGNSCPTDSTSRFTFTTKRDLLKFLDVRVSPMKNQCTYQDQLNQTSTPCIHFLFRFTHSHVLFLCTFRLAPSISNILEFSIPLTETFPKAYHPFWLHSLQ